MNALICDDRIEFLQQCVREKTILMYREAADWRDYRNFQIKKFGINILETEHMKEVDKRHNEFMKKKSEQQINLIKQQILIRG